MRNQEAFINAQMAEVLDGMRDGWEVSAEMLRAFRGRKIPDIMIRERGKPPIVIETEIDPARGLERDTVAKSSQITAEMEPVRAVISVVIPQQFRERAPAAAIRERLRSAVFKYRARIEGTDGGEWFPKDGFLTGTLADIAVTAQTINAATRDLDRRVAEVTEVIKAAAANVPEANAEAIAGILHQKAGDQTNQMAMAILLNAFVFQEVLSGIDFGDRGVPPTEENRNGDGHVSIRKTVSTWRAILGINYYPIFAMATKIIQSVTKTSAAAVIDVVASGADGIARLVAGAQDVTSSVFQSLIADQKILAAFYTRPETAAMIAEIVCPEDPDDCARATVADFACGTGILLHAVYRRLGQAYEIGRPAEAGPGETERGGGGNRHVSGRRMADRHRDMMERRLIGCDVLPSHIHLTASSMAGLHVRERFAGTRLYIMPYGKTEGFDANAEEYQMAMDEAKRLADHTKGLKKRAENAAPRSRAALDRQIKNNIERVRSLKADAVPKRPMNHVRCGSLELLSFTQTRVDAFDIGSGSILAASGSGEDRGVAAMDIRHGSCDIVVMNPPFSSAANPEQKSDDVHNPAFAGFDTDPDTQHAMSDRTGAIARGKIAGGRVARRSKKPAPKERIVAGGKMPVYFAHIADTMLRDGGTLALVLPLAFAQGESWAPLRQKILRDYDDILLVSAAEESSFSSDTSMGEAVLVGKKAHGSGLEKRVTFAVLKRVPCDPLAAVEIGRRLRSMRTGPPADILKGAGPSPVRIGNDEVANAVSARVSADDDPSFRINSIMDLSLAATAERLRRGTLYLGAKGHPVPIPIPMTTMDRIGEGGLLARDVDGDEKISGGRPRGPFAFSQNTANKRYPAVHSHDKDAQSQMRMEPDGYYVAKGDAEPSQVEKAWASSGRVIIATHWRFNTQPCVAGHVRTDVLGGSSFPNFNLYCKNHEKPFVVWQNSVFGALCFWFHSTRQQTGRGIVSKDLRKAMPVLDFSALDKGKLGSLERLFDRYADRTFLSLDRLAEDINRRSMDEGVAKALFDGRDSDAVCGALDWLYNALALEPTVRGRTARPEFT